MFAVTIHLPRYFLLMTASINLRKLENYDNGNDGSLFFVTNFNKIYDE